MSNRKYPEPEEEGDKYICPACGKEYASQGGYANHYKREHYETDEPQKSKEEVFETIENAAKQVTRNLEDRERLDATIAEEKELKDEQWNLLFSDLHYGLEVKGVEVGGLTEYNTDIAKERLDYLAQTLGRILEYHPNRPHTLNISFLGDMIDNAIMRNNQYASVEMGVTEQVMEVTELIVDFLVSLSKYFPEIKCFAVYGNHGRITKNKKDSDPTESFDRLVYWAIQDRIEDMDDISFESTKAQHMIVDIMGWRFWLEHGDTVRSWMHIPFYGAEREKKNILETLGHVDETIDYILLGHHHQLAPIWDLGTFFNGAFPGGDTYSIGHLRKMSLPSQLLLIISEKHGITNMRPIKLVEDATQREAKIYNQE